MTPESVLTITCPVCSEVLSLQLPFGHVHKKEKQPTSKHKDGERCDLPVWKCSNKHLPDKPHHFEYTGRIVAANSCADVWYEDLFDETITLLRICSTKVPHEELRLVIDEPFFVGQIVVWNHKIGEILYKNHETYFRIRFKDGSLYDIDGTGIHPATLAEIAEFYTCELAGEKVRAYEDTDGAILFYFKNGDCDFLGSQELSRYLCEKAGINIMPYSEVMKHYSGEFPAPKGE
jgi:hypothetical protein